MLKTSDCYKGKDVVLNTPLFLMQLNRKWHGKGIMNVSDLLDDSVEFLSLEDINSKYSINMTFPEHHILKWLSRISGKKLNI